MFPVKEDGISLGHYVQISVTDNLLLQYQFHQLLAERTRMISIILKKRIH